MRARPFASSPPAFRDADDPTVNDTIPTARPAVPRPGSLPQTGIG